MLFMTFVRAAFTIALNAHAGTTPTPTTTLPNDSMPVCAKTQVSGTVTDATGKGQAGVWVQDGVSKPLGQQVKTDSAGAFQLTVDEKHIILWVFRDSTSATPALGKYKKWHLQVAKCVAAPITIVLK